MTKTSPQSYEDLEVFRRSHQQALAVYALTRDFPAAERFRLIDQPCRAATSVPANIAEGYGRFHRRDLVRFLLVARGSAEETRYFLLLCKDLGYLPAETCQEARDQYAQIVRMLNGLIAHHRRQLSGDHDAPGPDP